MSSRFSLRVLHIWTIFENPLIVHRRKKLLFQRLLMNLQFVSPLQSYQDPTAVHTNERGTLISPSNDSALVITEGSKTATVPFEEPVTDTTLLPPRRYPQRVHRPPE